MSFEFTISDLRASLQTVNEKCRVLRGTLDERIISYNNLGFIFNYILELDNGFRELERIGLYRVEQEDFNAINTFAKQLDVDLAAGLHILNKRDLGISNRDSFTRLRRTGTRTFGGLSELDGFVNELRRSQETLTRRLQEIKRYVSGFSMFGFEFEPEIDCSI
jgi:hypothetical protein